MLQPVMASDVSAACSTAPRAGRGRFAYASPHQMSILRRLRRHGLAKTLRLGAYRLAQRFIVLDVTHLMMLDANDAVDPAIADDLTFDFLTPDEVSVLSRDGTNGLTTAMAERMSRAGDCCFAAFANHQLVGYAWFAFEHVGPECNRGESLLTGVGMSFPASMCFMYKGFVRPEFRGRRIYGRLMARALTLLAGRKITRVLSTADWTNYSALSSCYRIGYQYLGLVWRVGFPRRMFTVTPRSSGSLGIQFLDDPVDAERSSTVGVPLASTLPGGRRGV